MASGQQGCQWQGVMEVEGHRNHRPVYDAQSDNGTERTRFPQRGRVTPSLGQAAAEELQTRHFRSMHRQPNENHS